MAQAALIAFTAVKALSSIQQGKAQAASLLTRAAGLRQDAVFKRFEGRRQALKEKKIAVDKLTEIVQTLASINAAGAAGNIDPFSGNAEGLKIKTRKIGGTDALVAKENAAITILLFNEQAKQFEFAASQSESAAGQAFKQGVTNAILTVAAGAFQFSQLGGTVGGVTSGSSFPAMSLSGGGSSSPATGWFSGGGLGGATPSPAPMRRQTALLI